MDNKKIQLRKNMLSKLSKMDSATKSVKDLTIKKRLLEHNKYIVGQNIMFYMSFGVEIDTISIIKQMIKDRKTVYIPVTDPTDRSMIPARLLDIDSLVPGEFGILTHKEKDIIPIDKNKLDLVVVPGVVFDNRGYRIGHGGGYYDRFLEDLDVDTISILYDEQFIDKVPNEDHDIGVRTLITESKVIEVNS